MAEQTGIQITFGQSDSELENDERLKFQQRVLRELRDLDEVDRAERTERELTEAGEKGFSTLVGFLTAEVTLSNLKDFWAWFSERFADQPMKVKVKVKDQEIELEAKSRIELEQLEDIASSLLEKMGAGGAQDVEA